MADTSKQGKCSAIETQMIFTRSGDAAKRHSDFVVGAEKLEALEGPLILGLDGDHQAVYARWARPQPPRPVTLTARASTPGAEDFRMAQEQVARLVAAASAATESLPMGEPRALPEIAKVQGAPPPPIDDEAEKLIRQETVVERQQREQREQREQQPETQEQQPAAAAQTGASPQPTRASTLGEMPLQPAMGYGWHTGPSQQWSQCQIYPWQPLTTWHQAAWHQATWQAQHYRAWQAQQEEARLRATQEEARLQEMRASVAEMRANVAEMRATQMQIQEAEDLLRARQGDEKRTLEEDRPEGEGVMLRKVKARGEEKGSAAVEYYQQQAENRAREDEELESQAGEQAARASTPGENEEDEADWGGDGGGGRRGAGGGGPRGRDTRGTGQQLPAPGTARAGDRRTARRRLHPRPRWRRGHAYKAVGSRVEVAP